MASVKRTSVSTLTGSAKKRYEKVRYTVVTAPLNALKKAAKLANQPVDKQVLLRRLFPGGDAGQAMAMTAAYMQTYGTTKPSEKPVSNDLESGPPEGSARSVSAPESSPPEGGARSVPVTVMGLLDVAAGG